MDEEGGEGGREGMLIMIILWPVWYDERRDMKSPSLTQATHNII